jgi:hypothetical protein
MMGLGLLVIVALVLRVEVLLVALMWFLPRA